MTRSLVFASALVAAACAAFAGEGSGPAAAPAAGPPARAGGEGVRAEVDGAIAKVYPALVRIHVIILEYGGGREQKFEASGSGAIISPEGHVVTNHHVAGRATLITCTLSTREEISATLVGTDALADISVLKLNLSERKDPAAPIPVASFGDSDALRVGERVLAMGCPLALSQSVTMGIVSNADMILPERFTGGMELDGENVGSLVKWIGHDAQIFPGNSGGPLVNLRGEIVGINEIGVGLAGAIPSNLARRVVADLMKDGEEHRSWTGIELQPLLRGSGGERGVLVSGVVAGSPAEKAGVRAGDVLLAWDGRPVSARFDEEIPPVNRRMLETQVGRTVGLAVLRDGKEASLSLTTVERGRARGREQELRPWGISASDITPLMAVDLRRAPHSGALVSGIREGGPASEAKPPMRANDVITEVAGRKIETLDDLATVTAGIVKGKDQPVPTLVAFERRRERVLTVVKLGPEPEDRSTEARKAWFPAGVQVLTGPLADALGLKGRTGVRLTQVYPGTEVEAAGLQVGDVLVAMDGDPIPASQPEDVQVLPNMIRQRKIGSKVEFTVLRDGAERKVEVVLPARPPEGRELESWRDEVFDFSVRAVSFKDRVDNSWLPEQAGAVVSSVEPGGWAAFAGLDGGDLVLSVDGKPVGDVKSMKASMQDVEKRRPAHVAFQVRRGVHTTFVEVQPAWPAGR
jgi:serine protease Do